MRARNHVKWIGPDAARIAIGLDAVNIRAAWDRTGRTASAVTGGAAALCSTTVVAPAPAPAGV